MKLFELKDWELNVAEEVWGLEPFKKILKRDKSKDKATALKEMLFIYFYCDVKSDYLITPEKDRVSEIKKDIKLPDSWKMDSIIKDAIDYYSSFETITESLYKKAVNGANAVGDYLDKAEILLNERDKMDKPIYKTADITRALKDVKIIMRDLKEAEREVIKEKEDSSRKNSGSRQHNTFESGLI